MHVIYPWYYEKLQVRRIYYVTFLFYKNQVKVLVKYKMKRGLILAVLSFTTEGSKDFVNYLEHKVNFSLYKYKQNIHMESNHIPVKHSEVYSWTAQLVLTWAL